MTDYKSFRCGQITRYFDDHAVIAVSEGKGKKSHYVVKPDTNFAGAFDNAKTFAAMRAGMTVNVFFNSEKPSQKDLAFISPNLK